MQKNAYKIIALTLLLMLLCGCKQSRSLGERAIVKLSLIHISEPTRH